MKGRGNLKVGISGDCTDRSAICWFEQPVHFGGLRVLGVAPPMSSKARRRWQRIAEERGERQEQEPTA